MLEILEAQNCFFLYETLSCMHACLPQNDMGMRGREASPGARSHPISESSVCRACRTHIDDRGVLHSIQIDVFSVDLFKLRFVDVQMIYWRDS